MLERRRCHPLYIVEQLARTVGVLAVALLTSVMGAIEDNDISALANGGISFFAYFGLGALVLIGIIAFFTWLGWRNIWISAEDNTLIYESGILVKKRVTIPFSKINTIDMGRNVFQRLFGTCRLKVDTGAVANGEDQRSQMNIVFSLKDAEEFRSYILNRAAQDEQELRVEGATAIDAGTEPRWALQARFSDFMLYGLTSSSVMKVFLSVLMIFTLLAEVSESLLDSMIETIAPYAEGAWNWMSGSGIVMFILLVLGMFILLTIVSNIFTVAYSAIRYYGFRVAREGDNVVVRYGLISLKNYTVQAENVHAIVVKQNLLQQLIGRCSVEMVSIGYGNEENETNLLFPIIQKNKLGWLIETVLPEYSLSVEAYKPEKRSIRFLIVRPILWAALIFAAIIVACSFIMDSVALVVTAAVILMLVIIVNSVLRYRNNALGCDGKVMLARSGGTNVTTHLIRTDAVQSITVNSGIFQRPRKVATYRIDFHAPVLRNIAVVPHMNDDLLDDLECHITK